MMPPERASPVDLGRLCVPADHPSLPGHFPGAPVVPGVVVLDRLLEALRLAGWRVTGLPAVRFLAPVLPGEVLALSATPAGDTVLDLVATRDGATVLRGRAVAVRG